MRVYIGIDPGMNGGIGILSPYSKLSHCVPMPETAKQLADVLKEYRNLDVVAVVEKVGAMPGQGVVSMFKLGKGYGEIIGICSAYGFRILNPTPQAWKKIMLSGTDKSKHASIQRCENLFPDVDLVLPKCRKAHDGMAEALLLAEYGRRTI